MKRSWNVGLRSWNVVLQGLGERKKLLGKLGGWLDEQQGDAKETVVKLEERLWHVGDESGFGGDCGTWSLTRIRRHAFRLYTQPDMRTSATGIELKQGRSEGASA